MPKGIDYINFVYINLGFISLVFAMYYFSAVAEIKKNWPKYRCNPMFMPLSDNMQQDFIYCIQNMQTNFMGYLLQPLTFITSNLGSMGGVFSDAIGKIRQMLSFIRSMISEIIDSVFGVFLNLVIQFQKITMAIKDLVGKLIGVMVSIMYIMDGSVKTMQSAWNGPPGQMVRALGNCFHPETSIKLKNGNIVLMKDVNLGDILENGSRVDAIMKIDNKFSEGMYRLPDGEHDKYIYVTGTHMIYDETSKKFIEVKYHPDAVLDENVKCDWFSCLITDDHRIKLGKYIFWDWEDDILKI
jgi:hypothetical protein